MNSATQTLARPLAGDGPRVLAAMAVLATLALAAGVVLQPAETWAGVLSAAVFGITTALGGAVFVAIQALSGARWWLPLRRVPLLVARTLPVPALALGVCLALGLEVLYPWARPAAVEASPLLQEKLAWLNPPAFMARAALVVTIWLVLIGALRLRLREADRPGSAAWTNLARGSAAFLILLGVTLSVASWDWLMSLEPEWYSTMYVVYVFAGCLQGGVAAIVLVADGLERRGWIAPPSDSVRHDLGKLLFAFSTFWAYIWFCQLLLVWYSNLPEETVHYATRWDGGWTMFFFLDLAFSWVLPFVVLLPVATKRRPAALKTIAAVVLIGRSLDCHVLVAPALGPAQGFPFATVAATFVVVLGMLFYGRRLLHGDS